MSLDEAVQNGLNLITIYVMWSAYQPLPDKNIDWSFLQQQSTSCQQMLDHQNQPCADRGLFVHLRIGPYTCAEYSYGGIPEWLLVQKPRMRLRQANADWLEVMESWLAQITEYITENKLWAHQGKFCQEFCLTSFCQSASSQHIVLAIY
jgi:hypothetical protein